MPTTIVTEPFNGTDNDALAAGWSAPEHRIGAVGGWASVNTDGTSVAVCKFGNDDGNWYYGYYNSSAGTDQRITFEANLNFFGTSRVIAVLLRRTAADTFYRFSYAGAEVWLHKVVSGSETQIGSTITVGGSSLSTVAVRGVFSVVGTTLTAKLKRLDDNTWLQSDGSWGTEANCFSETDSAISGASYAGIGYKTTSQDKAVIDNVVIESLDATSATAYTLEGPAGDLTRNTESGNFTVTPNGDADGDIVVTPSDGGAGGVFNPTSVTFLDGDDSAKTFKYTPRAAGGASVTISVTNDGGLTDPADVTKDVNVVLTQFRITGTPTLIVAGSADYVIDTEQAGSIS